MAKKCSSMIIFLIILSATACSVPVQQKNTPIAPVESEPVQIANPASQNCVDKGGTLSIQERGDGGQFGVCYFEDNRQCEEWALLRGECPQGGLKVTGYITSASQYCVITGGSYTITGSSGADDEQGTCTFSDGEACDVWDYYNGICSPAGSESTASQESTAPQEYSGSLVFDSTRSGDYRDLFTMNLDGSGLIRLTQGESNSFAGPYSPDGRHILYTGFGLTNSYIAVINADGSDQTILDQVDGSDEGFPDWSPDGQRIAFTSHRDGNNEIYVMNTDSSNQVNLTNHPADDFAPSWSPDGQQIAFVSDRDQSAGIYDLYLMNADGSGVTRLTNDTAIDYSPDWSPDGRQIIFRSHHDGAADIYLINVDGSGLVNLTSHPSEDWAPTWSPNGTLVAFQTNRDGNWEIYLMSADGTNPLNLTISPSDDQSPYWKP